MFQLLPGIIDASVGRGLGERLQSKRIVASGGRPICQPGLQIQNRAPATIMNKTPAVRLAFCFVA